jgi:hypothetical protein
MTGALGKPEPLPYVDENDLLELAADLGPGVFIGADVYNWYVSLAEQSGRAPVSKKKFGMALGEAGWTSSLEYRGGRMARCWVINKPWYRRGMAHINEPTES